MQTDDVKIIKQLLSEQNKSQAVFCLRQMLKKNQQPFFNVIIQANTKLLIRSEQS